MNHYQHTIWDWNGTLFDDAWLCLEIMNRQLDKRGLPGLTAERYQQIFDFPVIDYYRHLGFDFSVEPFFDISEARVVAIVGSGKEEKMGHLGAEFIVTRDTENLYKAVTEALGGQTIDVVADVVGGTNFSALLRLLRKQGRYVTAGAIAGPTAYHLRLL